MAKEKKRFRLFDFQRDGRGISKNNDLPPSSLKRFFRTYWENLGKIVGVNIFFVLGNFPLIFLIITLSGYTKDPTLLPFYDVFQNVNAVTSIEGVSPSAMSLMATYGVQNQILQSTTITYVFYGLSALTFFTFGIVNVGTAYVLRNIAKGDPVFVWSDFWYAVKRNWKQALPFGFFDALIHCILIMNIYTNLTSANFLSSMIFWVTIVIFILYFFMRCYIYVQMVTFKLSTFKILKNSLIFALVGLKRNLMALLGALVFLLFEILFLFSTGVVLLPLAIALPLAIMFSTVAYMKVFASYFKIKELIIDPYYEEHPDELPDRCETETVMRDDVTEKERIAAIKRARGIIDDEE